MDDPMVVGLNADAMRDLLVLAVQEHVAARRLDLGKAGAPVYIASFAHEFAALLTSLSKTNPSCVALFQPEFFLLGLHNHPYRAVDPVLKEFNHGLARGRAWLQAKLAALFCTHWGLGTRQ